MESEVFVVLIAFPEVLHKSRVPGHFQEFGKLLFDLRDMELLLLNDQLFDIKFRMRLQA